MHCRMEVSKATVPLWIEPSCDQSDRAPADDQIDIKASIAAAAAQARAAAAALANCNHVLQTPGTAGIAVPPVGRLGSQSAAAAALPSPMAAAALAAGLSPAAAAATAAAAAANAARLLGHKRPRDETHTADHIGSQKPRRGSNDSYRSHSRGWSSSADSRHRRNSSRRNSNRSGSREGSASPDNQHPRNVASAPSDRRRRSAQHDGASGFAGQQLHISSSGRGRSPVGVKGTSNDSSKPHGRPASRAQKHRGRSRSRSSGRRLSHSRASPSRSCSRPKSSRSGSPSHNSRSISRSRSSNTSKSRDSGHNRRHRMSSSGRQRDSGRSKLRSRSHRSPSQFPSRSHSYSPSSDSSSRRLQRCRAGGGGSRSPPHGRHGPHAGGPIYRTTRAYSFDGPLGAERGFGGPGFAPPGPPPPPEMLSRMLPPGPLLPPMRGPGGWPGDRPPPRGVPMPPWILDAAISPAVKRQLQFMYDIGVLAPFMLDVACVQQLEQLTDGEAGFALDELGKALSDRVRLRNPCGFLIRICQRLRSTRRERELNSDNPAGLRDLTLHPRDVGPRDRPGSSSRDPDAAAVPVRRSNDDYEAKDPRGAVPKPRSNSRSPDGRAAVIWSDKAPAGSPGSRAAPAAAKSPVRGASPSGRPYGSLNWQAASLARTIKQAEGDVTAAAAGAANKSEHRSNLHSSREDGSDVGLNESVARGPGLSKDRERERNDRDRAFDRTPPDRERVRGNRDWDEWDQECENGARGRDPEWRGLPHERPPFWPPGLPPGLPPPGYRGGSPPPRFGPPGFWPLGPRRAGDYIAGDRGGRGSPIYDAFAPPRGLGATRDSPPQHSSRFGRDSSKDRDLRGQHGRDRSPAPGGSSRRASKQQQQPDERRKPKEDGSAALQRRQQQEEGKHQDSRSTAATAPAAGSEEGIALPPLPRSPPPAPIISDLDFLDTKSGGELYYQQQQQQYNGQSHQQREDQYGAGDDWYRQQQQHHDGRGSQDSDEFEIQPWDGSPISQDASPVSPHPLPQTDTASQPGNYANKGQAGQRQQCGGDQYPSDPRQLHSHGKGASAYMQQQHSSYPQQTQLSGWEQHRQPYQYRQQQGYGHAGDHFGHGPADVGSIGQGVYRASSAAAAAAGLAPAAASGGGGGAPGGHSELRVGVTEVIKDIMKPLWKSGKLSREAFKTVAKKATDKVLAGLPPPGAPDAPAEGAEGVAAYLNEPRRVKIRALVDTYVAKYGHL